MNSKKTIAFFVVTITLIVYAVQSRMAFPHGGGTDAGHVSVAYADVSATHTVTVMAGAGGSVTPMSATVQTGETAVFTISPNAGFIINAANGCGGFLFGSSFATEAITADCTITVAFLPVASAGDVHVTATALQTMIGIEASTTIGSGFCPSVTPASASYDTAVVDEIYRQAVEDLGLDRMRLEIRSGVENTTDWYGQIVWLVLDPGSDPLYQTWKTHRYEVINDNSDPNQPLASGFHYTELDQNIVEIVNPLRQRLAAQGRSLYVSLNYVSFTSETQSNLHRDTPAEYAEFMVEAIKHIETTYGWLPDAVEVLLEPDILTAPSFTNVNWTAAEYAAVVAALVNRLAAEGYSSIEIIGPSTTDMEHTAVYFDTAVAQTGFNPFAEISYHKYDKPPNFVTPQYYTEVRERKIRYGIRSGMLEHIGDTHLDFERDLTDALVSTWTQLGLAICMSNDGDYFYIDESDPNNVTVSIKDNVRYLPQYSRTVHRGAVRYETVSSNPARVSFAFQNPDGTWTAVIRSDLLEDFTISGLPAGTYELFYTSAAAYLQPLADRTTDANGLLHVPMPEMGVITVHQKPTAVTSHLLTVARSGTGSGTVSSSPAGIDCGADCTEMYAEGTVVTLTAVANPPATFTGWSGGGCSGAGSCVVTMNGVQTVTAVFTNTVSLYLPLVTKP